MFLAAFISDLRDFTLHCHFRCSTQANLVRLADKYSRRYSAPSLYAKLKSQTKQTSILPVTSTRKNSTSGLPGGVS